MANSISLMAQREGIIYALNNCNLQGRDRKNMQAAEATLTTLIAMRSNALNGPAGDECAIDAFSEDILRVLDLNSK